jgi:hypothetical protein
MEHSHHWIEPLFRLPVLSFILGLGPEGNQRELKLIMLLMSCSFHTLSTGFAIEALTQIPWEFILTTANSSEMGFCTQSNDRSLCEAWSAFASNGWLCCMHGMMSGVHITCNLNKAFKNLGLHFDMRFKTERLVMHNTISRGALSMHPRLSEHHTREYPHSPPRAR